MIRFGIELLVRGMALCLLTAILLVLFRRAAAAYRHLICVLALSGLLILPLTQRLLPPLPLLPPQSAATPEGARFPQWEAARLSGLYSKSTMLSFPNRLPEPSYGAETAALLPIQRDSGAHGNVALIPVPHLKRAAKTTSVLLAIWALGASFLLIRLLVTLSRLRRLEAESQEAILDGVPIRISEQVTTPLTWGIRRSVILLPTALYSGDPAVRASAVSHEKAHIARWDWAWNLFAEVVCALCWFQPCVWWLRRRMRLESERACDDRVLLSGVAGHDYAAHLLEIVRSVCINEVAPAMAHGRGMEERMRHILNDAAPRNANAKWLAVSAPLAFALLSLAALRVSARPADVTFHANAGVAAMKSNKEFSTKTKAAVPTGKAGATSRADGAQANASPAATLDNANPVMPLENVAWGKAVDGLEPGFLLTTPDFQKSRRVPLNAHVAYQVLVRNVSGQARCFRFACSQYDPSESGPYLIPSRELRNALRSGVIPQQFRAMGVTNLAVAPAAYEVSLAPGETVVAPEEFGLTLGDADKQSFPRVEAVQAGMNWIVHPVRIHLLTATETVEFESMSRTPYSSKKAVRITDRHGNTSQRFVPLVGGLFEGKPLFAGTELEVGTKRDWTLAGHSQMVNVVVFSPDSKRLLTGSADGTAMVWDVATGRSRTALKGSTAPVTSALYTPNGKFIITGCSDGAIYVWDAMTGAKLRSLGGDGGGVCALDISADGAKLLSGHENGRVKLWNTATGQGLDTFAYENRLLSAAISPNGQRITAAYADATVKDWDVQTRHLLFSKSLPRCEGITSLHFDTNGTLYAWYRELSKDGKSKPIAMTALDDKGAILAIISWPFQGNTVRSAVCYADFTMLSGLADGQAVLNGSREGPVTLDAHEGAVAAVALSPDGTLGATGGQRNGRGEAKIWDIQAHKPASQPK